MPYKDSPSVDFEIELQNLPFVCINKHQTWRQDNRCYPGFEKIQKKEAHINLTEVI